MPELQQISLQETVGGKTITLQTGTLAKQASGSVTVHLEDTCILTTTTVAKDPKAVSFSNEIHVLYRDIYDNLSDAYWTGTTWTHLVRI